MRTKQVQRANGRHFTLKLTNRDHAMISLSWLAGSKGYSQLCVMCDRYKTDEAACSDNECGECPIRVINVLGATNCDTDLCTFVCGDSNHRYMGFWGCNDRRKKACYLKMYDWLQTWERA